MTARGTDGSPGCGVADLRHLWAADDEARRLRLAARVGRGGEARHALVVARPPSVGPAAPHTRAFGPSHRLAVLHTLGDQVIRPTRRNHG